MGRLAHDQTSDGGTLERVTQELEFRTAVTTAMLSTLDLDKVLYVILCGITSGDGLGFNRAFLLLDDETGRALRLTLAVGPPDQESAVKIWEEINRGGLKLPELLVHYENYRNDPTSQALTQRMAGFQIPLQDLASLAKSPQELMVEHDAPLVSVIASCLINRAPFASNALTLFHEVGGASGDLMEFRRVAIEPLTVAGRIIGAILADNIYTDNAVSSEDLRQLHALGNLAALAIDRARLHTKTVAMAEVDGLTGVYNRRYYQGELERALELTRWSGAELSVVIFDLDFFKSYNDRHGHLIGDQILKDVARLLKKNVRQSDLIARYGGEEFVVLLTETAAETAKQIAEKLLEIVKQTPMAEGRVWGLTMSAGVASTAGGDSAEELFDRADRALYQAKATGRDRVAICCVPRDEGS